MRIKVGSKFKVEDPAQTDSKFKVINRFLASDLRF